MRKKGRRKKKEKRKGKRERRIEERTGRRRIFKTPSGHAEISLFDVFDFYMHKIRLECWQTEGTCTSLYRNSHPKKTPPSSPSHLPNLSPPISKSIVFLPPLPDNTRARLLDVPLPLLNLIRSIRARREEQILHDLATRFARGSLQEPTLRHVELHRFGRRHAQVAIRVVGVGARGREEVGGSVCGAGRAEERAAGAGCAEGGGRGVLGVGFGGG